MWVCGGDVSVLSVIMSAEHSSDVISHMTVIATNAQRYTRLAAIKWPLVKEHGTSWQAFESVFKVAKRHLVATVTRSAQLESTTCHTHNTWHYNSVTVEVGDSDSEIGHRPFDLITAAFSE